MCKVQLRSGLGGGPAHDGDGAEHGDVRFEHAVGQGLTRVFPYQPNVRSFERASERQLSSYQLKLT
jgi:hypothetical protein